MVAAMLWSRTSEWDALIWQTFNGTIVNASAVGAGTVVGLSLGRRLPQRYQQIILTSLGLVTVMLAIDAGALRMNAVAQRFQPPEPAGRGYGARLAMVTVGSLLVGAVLGTALRLHERLEAIGHRLHARFGVEGQRSLAEGFLTASVLFCVGPLTLLGCLANGMHGDPTYLYIKSFLDAFAAMALTAAMGIGVAFSVITVVLFQGGLALAARWLAGGIPELSRELMNVVGGYVLFATGLTLLDIKKVPVANLLPGIFLPPIVVWVAEQIWPHALMRAG
jgi:hypothetical protein